MKIESGFRDWLDGFMYAGGAKKLESLFGVKRLKDLTGEQFLELFKIYEKQTAPLQTNLGRAHSRNIVAGAETATDVVVADTSPLPVFLQKRTTIILPNGIAPSQDMVVSEQEEEPAPRHEEPTLEVVAPRKEYTEEQILAFEQLKARISERTDTVISPNSTPGKVEMLMMAEGSMVIIRMDAVKCLDKIKRVEQKEVARRRQLRISPDKPVDEKT